MYKIVRSEWVDWETYRYSIICDSEDDVASLPKGAPSSVAIVAAKNGPVYITNASGEWKEQ